MKLWQKVFLATVAVFVAAAEIISGFVLFASLKSMVNRETEKAVQTNTSASRNIRYALSRYRITYDYRPGDAAGLESYFTEALQSVEKDAPSISSICIYSAGELFLGDPPPILLENEDFVRRVSSSSDGEKISETLNINRVLSDFPNSNFENGVAASNGAAPLESGDAERGENNTAYVGDMTYTSEVSTLVTERNEKNYIICGSHLTVDFNDYAVFCVTDITSLYDEYTNLFLTAQIFSIVFAVVLASLLIFILTRLMSPLSKINSFLKEFSGGEYGIRLDESGSAEFKELKKNINVVAKSVEENTDRIEEIAESRKRFVDNFAHEMKTPLTSIMGFADIMRIKRTLDDKKRQEYSGLILEEARRMKALSSKLLEIAAADNASLDLEDIPVRRLFEEVYVSVVPILHQNKMKMTVAMSDSELVIRADRELFKSLLYNLIDNAIKASKEGDEIALTCQTVKNRILISVTDKGIGMSGEVIKKVTEPFFMADKARSRSRGGAGLGLSLCSDIAKRHGAVLKIKSEQSKGTTVTVVMRQSREKDR